MFGRKNFIITKLFSTLVPLWTLSFGLPVFAQGQELMVMEDLLDMSLEDLMDVEVISGSRQAQKLSETSVPVTVITAEDIQRSGLTSIPQILQFACGVDVLQSHRDLYAVGVRGLHGVISDRVKMLVNGRLADNAHFGGPEFSNLPVMMEDIERIEIVRGPSGAVWGANAFTGVINIITKKPEDVLGYLATTTVSEWGDTYNHLRWAEKQGLWSWRVSAGYEDLKSSEDAIDGSASHRSYYPALNVPMGFDGFVARDFSRNERLDTEAIYRPSDCTEVAFGTGYSHGETGAYEQLGYFPQRDSRNELVRSFAKLEHEFQDGGSGHVQWFGNFWNAYFPQYGLHHAALNELEGMYNFARAGRHQLSIGANLQWTRVNTQQRAAQEYWYPGEPFDEHMEGLFAVDRYDVTDRLTIEGQVRVDSYSETTTDWAGRLAGLYALDEQKRHVLRLGTAKAYRTPLPAVRQARGQKLPVGGGLYALNVELPTTDLRNEETWSIEAGYTGLIAERVTCRANTYFQRFERLIGHVKTIDGFGLSHYTPFNIDGADSWGAELELVIEGTRGRFSTWYAYNDFAPDQSGQSVRANLPAQHKVGLMGRVYLQNDWAFNANYRYTDTTPGNPSADFPIGSSHRLDLTVSKDIIQGKGELLVGVSDLLNKTHDPIKGNSTMTGQEIPGRMFFARMKLDF